MGGDSAPSGAMQKGYYMKIGNIEGVTFTPVLVDYKDASWRATFGMALGHILLPLLIILSKVLKREIAFMEHDCDDAKELLK